MFRIPSLAEVKNTLRRLWGGSKGVVQETSAAVGTIVNDSNIIESPTLADFEALETGDTLVSINPGTERIITAINKEKKELACKVVRSTTPQSLPLVPFYRSKADKMYMSKRELLELSPNTQVFTMNGTELIPTTLHVITPGRLPTDPLTGRYSFDTVCTYLGHGSIISTTKKIIKKGSK